MMFNDEFDVNELFFREDFIEDPPHDYEDIDIPLCNKTQKKYIQCKELYLDKNNMTKEILHPNQYYYQQKLLVNKRKIRFFF